MAKIAKKPKGTPFSERLKSLRHLAQYDTGREFAAELGYPEARYGRWERGEVEPGIEALTKIQETTNVPLDWLVAGKRTGPLNIRVNPNYEPEGGQKARKY